MRRSSASRRPHARHQERRGAVPRRVRGHRGQGGIARLLLPPGLPAQLRAGYRLARTTPGLTVYVGGGLAVWLACRTLAAQGLAAGLLGAVLLAALRLGGYVAVVLLYFRRTGRLAGAHADLCRLHVLLAARQPWRTEPGAGRRLLLRLLGWALRVCVGGEAQE